MSTLLPDQLATKDAVTKDAIGATEEVAQDTSIRGIVREVNAKADTTVREPPDVGEHTRTDVAFAHETISRLVGEVSDIPSSLCLLKHGPFPLLTFDLPHSSHDLKVQTFSRRL